VRIIYDDDEEEDNECNNQLIDYVEEPNDNFEMRDEEPIYDNGYDNGETHDKHEEHIYEEYETFDWIHNNFLTNKWVLIET